MTPDLINALRDSLRSHLTLRKSRLESFCVLVMGVLLSRSVNLSHLAGLFPTSAEISSNYRRLQRFFEQVTLEPEQLAQLIAALAGLGKGPWLIALDRTNWKFGRRHINILMLAVVRGSPKVKVVEIQCTSVGNVEALG